MTPGPLNPHLATWTADQLARQGCTRSFRCEALLVEASHRHFYRIHAERGGVETSFVLMRSPPTKENNSQFVALARVFADHGVNVPTVLGEEPANGFYLVSDLGERHLADAYGTGLQDQALRAAIDTLIRIQTIDDARVPPYEPDRFRDELAIFRIWFIERWLAQSFPHSDLDSVFELLVDNTQRQPQCCVHRDYHSRNLLLDEDGRIGVVDFQDALVGPVSYDLASLLRDCYHRFSEREIDRWRDYYLDRAPAKPDPAAFAAQLDLTAAQRQLKAVGIFARLQLRDDKPSHLTHIAPVLQHLHDLASRYDALAPLAGHLALWQSDSRSRLTGPP